MKTRPILFSAEMVRAILCGRKNVTRRVVNWPTWAAGYETHLAAQSPAVGIADYRDGRPARRLTCPQGMPGDKLWVREEYYQFGHWEPVETKRTRTGRQKWRFVADPNMAPLFSPPPEGYRKGRHHEDPHTPAWHKRLARFMPHAIARISLEVVDVRVERLHEITEDDALAEGVSEMLNATGDGGWGAGQPAPSGYSYRNAFRYLWNTINGERHGASWDDDPWVWRVAFRRLP